MADHPQMCRILIVPLPTEPGQEDETIQKIRETAANYDLGIRLFASPRHPAWDIALGISKLAAWTPVYVAGWLDQEPGTKAASWIMSHLPNPGKLNILLLDAETHRRLLKALYAEPYHPAVLLSMPWADRPAFEPAAEALP